MTQEIDIKAIREKFNATQAKLAEVIGVDQSTISDWETGRSKPRGPTRKLIMSLKDRDFSRANRSKARQSEAAQ